jgi:predicted ATPase
MGIVSSTAKSLCRFTHPLLREVLSSQATTGERVQLHRAIALALEEIRSDDLRPYLSVLAHHWRECARSPEEIDKAIDYSIRAGDAAAKASALGEAVLRWDDALTLNKEHQCDLQQRAKILVRLGGVWPRRRQQALMNLEDALAIYEHLGMTTEVAKLHTRLCLFHHAVDIDLPRAEKHFRQAEALLQQVPPNASMVHLYDSWCEVCLWRSRVPEAFDAASRALELAEAIDDRSVHTRAVHTMAEGLFAVGRLRECLELEERAWGEADNDWHSASIPQMFFSF